ncbi:hypothetical protein E3U43_016594, partial [Larimichthys crocea]
MTAHSFSSFIVFITHLSLIYCYDFKVIQPQNRTVNQDELASISCEHTAEVTSVEDFQLLSMSPTDSSGNILCQKGVKKSENITCLEVNPKKFLFIIFNIGPEDMSMKYVCEITVKDENDLHHTERGRPTTLLPGQTEVVSISPPPPPLPLHHSLKLWWIAIGLLALMFLYSCVITSFYIRLR